MPTELLCNSPFHKFLTGIEQYPSTERVPGYQVLKQVPVPSAIFYDPL